MTLRFYPGLHQPSDAGRFERCCLSIRRLWGRRKPITCPDVLVDSAAFTELALHGRYRAGVEEYAAEIRRLHDDGVLQISAAVAQDFMCEPFMLEKTGLTVAEHQRLTLERFDELAACKLPVPIMPVIQGYEPASYARHVAAYGDRLAPGAWVGVGSVCKRNASPEAILDVLCAIQAERPDLRLHGFGVKITALEHPEVRARLHSADSTAWSFAARWEARDRNAWTEAAAYAERVRTACRPVSQLSLPFYPERVRLRAPRAP